jgi:hypothetical protein
MTLIPSVVVAGENMAVERAWGEEQACVARAVLLRLSRAMETEVVIQGL